jgi:glycosyltransferase involved in cell wall biosynthesis
MSNEDPMPNPTGMLATSRSTTGSVAGQPRAGGAIPPTAVSLLFVATVAPTIRFLVPYAAHFRALGWRVDAVASGAGDDQVLQESFDHVYELPLSRSIRDVTGIVRAGRAMSELLGAGLDIVHVHTPIAAFVTRVAVRRSPAERRPAVAYTAHGFHFYEGGNPATNALFLTAERVAGRWTDRLIVINDEDDAAAKRNRIVPRSRLVHMPGIGIDTRTFSPSSVLPDGVARVRGQLGIAADAPIFVVIGELNRNKRQHDVIAALASMQHADAHLVLLGDGPERPTLEAFAAHLRLQDRVHPLGHVDDVRPVLRAGTALVMPSKREGLSRSVMEALALEVPVIASAARGNRELIGIDRGILVATADVRGLADAMDRLIDHPDERRAMGLRGRERIVERHDLQDLIRMHEELYRAMLAERSSRMV